MILDKLFSTCIIEHDKIFQFKSQRDIEDFITQKFLKFLSDFGNYFPNFALYSTPKITLELHRFPPILKKVGNPKNFFKKILLMLLVFNQLLSTNEFGDYEL